MTMLAVEKLNAFYGAAQVLWDISLTINENEIVALIGTNGAGKTTLMRTISGLVPKTGAILCIRENPSFVKIQLKLFRKELPTCRKAVGFSRA